MNRHIGESGFRSVVLVYVHKVTVTLHSILSTLVLFQQVTELEIKWKKRKHKVWPVPAPQAMW